MNPGEFKVIFADAQPEESTAAELHANFRLAAGSGAAALSRTYLGQPQLVDYLNYANVTAGSSFGSLPDGQSFDRQEFFYVTPGSTNNGAPAPLNVRINEWMASNTHTLANPSHNNAYDDWFELYNPGMSYEDLAGYYLTDNLANKFQFRVPSGYGVPPRGFLLVWADNAPGLNSPNSADLHVNFQLAKSGEHIGLFAADGTQIDAVTFGPQTNDVSQGRYPDGTGLVYFPVLTATCHRWLIPLRKRSSIAAKPSLSPLPPATQTCRRKFSPSASIAACCRAWGSIPRAAASIGHHWPRNRRAQTLSPYG